MERDKGLINELLIKISEAEGKPSFKDLIPKDNDGEQKRVLEHLKLMQDSGLIKSVAVTLHGFWMPQQIELSASGHDAVDAIRTRELQTNQKGASTMTQANSHPSYSRQTIICAADMLKALGHSGLNRFILELELPDSTAGQGSGLLARATSLADFAIKNPQLVSPERRTIAYEIILRAIQIWQDGMTMNLSSGERDKFEAAMRREGLSSRLVKTDDGDEVSVSDPASRKPKEATLKQSPIPTPSLPRRVFIVHGHDDGARLAVARFLERLEFSVTILHEQANKGRTIIEKFEDHSDVGFVVVLLTPDDVGGKANEAQQQRARQNVILEWGYFIGRLGRARVCALKKGNLEIPSDILGIVWEVFDDHEAWKSKLAKELAAAGFEIDWAKVAL